MREIRPQTYFLNIRDHILEQDPFGNHLLQLIQII